MNLRLARMLGLLLILFLAAPVVADDDEKGPKDKEDKEEEKKDETKFEDLIEDCETVEGLFTFYHDPEEGKLYLEIEKDQLDTIYLCNLQRDAGDGYFFDSGTMAGSFPFEFQKVGKKIRWVHKNVYYRADEDSPIAAAVERGLTDSVVGSAKIERGPHPDRNSYLVDASSLFLQDHLNIGKILSSNERVKREYKYDKDESFFAWVKSFKHNSEIETVAHYKGSRDTSTNMRIPDARSMEHRYRFSLSEIPQSDYVPRIADERVGHFSTMFQDYSSLERETPYTWYVERWNLEKSNSRAKMSKPKEPITFWIENTVPHEYRKAVRDGALMWNQGFEQLGFKDAVVVKQMPDNADWDPADIRYNVIRWIVMPGGGYAVGPSSANPFTGELYAADIRISADYVRYMFLRFEEQIHPLAGFADAMELDVIPQSDRACSYGSTKSREVAFGMDVLAARGYVDTNSDEYQRYVYEALVDLVAHEVGHTLGMRHNFLASTQHDLADLHSPDITMTHGLTGSVMDYSPVNIAPKGTEQGQYFHTTLGTYDKWAVEYAYKPINGDPESQLEELEQIASRAADPRLAYATDEDAFGNRPQGINPLANMWDLSNDPIGYYEQRMTLTKELLTSIDKAFGTEGARYQKQRAVFGRAMGTYFQAASTVPRFLAGLHHRRDRVGDPNGRTPLEPVSVADQRRAMDFLTNHLFAQNAFEMPANLARNLAPERRLDFDWSVYYQPRVDYPVHSVLLGAQNAALGRIYHPIVLNRLVDFPLYFEGQQQPLGMYQIFDEVASAIWSELESKQNIDSFRRNLQRAHLSRLVSLVADPQGTPYYSPSSGRRSVGTLMPPQDARSFARANLVSIRSNIDSVLAQGSLNPETQAHLDETRARIVAVLDAGIERDL